jgi:acetyl-CoA synthetase
MKSPEVDSSTRASADTWWQTETGGILITPLPGVTPSGYNGGGGSELQGALKEQVRHAIGAFATPDVIQIAPGLPKTRSGKIMRRILRKIAAGEYGGLGDVTTLAEPEVVETLIQQHAEQVVGKG